jgi:EAL domain-containing protein (putative c-di-GMP-specific phosphodiesterase class I)
VIVEWIGDEKDIKVAKDLDADFGQGYYWDKKTNTIFLAFQNLSNNKISIWKKI